MIYAANIARYIFLCIGVTISILIGYVEAANSCWFCFRYVIPTDNSLYTCRVTSYPQRTCRWDVISTGNQMFARRGDVM